MKVYLCASGSGATSTIGYASDLDEASDLVRVLAARWAKFEKENYDFDCLHEDDPLLHYEGCDIYIMVGTNHTAYFLHCEGDVDEPIAWDC